MRRMLAALAGTLIACAASAAIAAGVAPAEATDTTSIQPPETAPAVHVDRDHVDVLLRRYAAFYKVPVRLARRIVQRESRFDPAARNGPYWGLMQIRHDTARGVGYRGSPSGLLDAETNLAFGMAYLANALVVASGDERRAEQLFRTGFYYEAKRKRLLAKLIQGERQDVQVAAATTGPATPPAPPLPPTLAATAPELQAEPPTLTAAMAGAPPEGLPALPRPRPLVGKMTPTVVAPTVTLASVTPSPFGHSARATLELSEPLLEAQALVASPPPLSRRSPALAAIREEAPRVETALCCDFDAATQSSPPLPRRRPAHRPDAMPKPVQLSLSK